MTSDFLKNLFCVADHTCTNRVYEQMRVPVWNYNIYIIKKDISAKFKRIFQQILQACIKKSVISAYLAEKIYNF